MRARGRAFHYCLENYLLMLTTEAHVLMKVSQSLLLLALVTAAPVFAAEDEIWGPAEQEKTESATEATMPSPTEEDVVDQMPSPVDSATEGVEDEAD